MIILNSLGTVVLYTKRCKLRRFELNDTYNVFNNYSSLKEVTYYLTNQAHKSIYETEYMIYEFIKNYNNLNYYNWIVTELDNNNVIGTISLHEIDLFSDKAEIGIIISPYYQNKGYAKEVIFKIIDFAFNYLNIYRLEAKIFSNNIASNKTFKSLNFNYEGILHSVVKKENKFYDVKLYYLLNEYYKF